jgi:uncharacterized membrane protein YedE/YeeE
LLVVGLYALANKPLGATGAYLQTMSLVVRRQSAEPWRVAYFGGLFLGAIVATFLKGGASFQPGFGYGALGDSMPVAGLIVILLGAGFLMGYGARWMGGCTSGHGLCGVSALAVGSILATVTFFSTAVATTFLLHWLTGGAI